MKAISKSVFSKLVISVLITSSASFAQSIAQEGKQCSGEMAISSLTCINPEAGIDARLYITEFQDCKSGNITSLEKSVIGIVFPESTLETEEAKTEVVYSGVRTHVDERVDALSMEVPTSAVIKTSQSTVTMSISTEIESDYEGADITTNWHYKGSFVRVNSKGIKSAGKLICSITR